MNDRLRKGLALLLAGALLTAGGAWLFLKLGRPAFYTDGARELRSFALRSASVLIWDRPEPECEIPGPVQGRVQALPDGRLLYGQVLADGTTDLVLFDPRRPGLPPEAVVGLNSAGHDLAPALGDDGTLYFASDRPGGAGGFDLYAARWTGGSFTGLRRLPDTVNSQDDEADPAPEPGGARLVFVRREPALHEGRNGRLLVADLGGEALARPVFPDDVRTAPVIDRDPTLSPDGGSLWFVRQEPAGAPRLMRSTRHLGTFGAALVEETLSGAGAFRAPAFAGDSFRLRLLAMPPPGEAASSLPATSRPATARLYTAAARTLLPWWEGQRELESFLVSFLAFCVALLVLLWLGQRWKQLDLITQCLLLSLLVHLLILVWLRRVEILQQVLPPAPRAGTLEVEILGGAGHDLRAAGGGGDGGGGGLEGGLMSGTDVAAMAEFPGGERTLTAGAPAPALAAALPAPGGAAAALAGTGPQFALPDGGRGADAAPLADAVAAGPTRAGHEQHAVPGAAPVALSADQRNAVAAARAAGSEAPIQITVPGQGPGGAGGGDAGLPAAGRGASLLAAAASVPGSGGGVGGGGSGSGAAATTPRALGAGAMSVADAPGPDAGAVRGSAGPGDGLAPVRPSAAGALVAGAGGGGSGGSAITAPPAPMPAGAGGGGTGDGPIQITGPGTGLAGAPRSERAQTVALGGGAGSGGSGLTAAQPRTAGRGPGNAALLDRPEGGSAAPRGTGADAGTATANAAPGGGLRPGALPGGDGPSGTGFGPVRTQAGAPDGTGPARGSAAVGVVVPGSLLGDPRGTARTAAAAALTTKTGASAGGTPAARRGPVAVGGLGLRDAPEIGAGNTPGPASPKVAGGGRAPGWPAPGRLGVGMAGPEGPVAAFLPPAAGVLAGARADGARDAGIRVPGSFLERARRDTTAHTPVAEASPLPGVYANRFGARKAQALDTFGGSEATEKAVRLGLGYLARIQNRDGSWGNEGTAHPKYGQTFVGKTGLCLLAMLGAGHTPQSGTEHSDHAARAVRFLLGTQDPDTGHFGTSCAYSHGITTYALAECYALTQDAQLRAPLERAVAWILRNQSTSRSLKNQGGWGYYSNQLQPEDGYSRVSVSAWQVMALESARLSGLEVPDAALAAARRFLLYCFDPRHGYYLYNHEPSRLSSAWRTLPASTPAASFCLQLLGLAASDERIATGLRYTLERAPDEYRRYSEDEFVRDAGGNVYFWYYGTLASFLAGGETWERWNSALKRVLPPAQAKDGSFRPIDPYATYAGDNDRERAYTTAMCVLSLEVYYRYFTPLLKPR